jgi:hypothetical protein
MEVLPEEFKKVMRDFIQDIRMTFPEYQKQINVWWKTNDDFLFISNLEDRKKAIEQSELQALYYLFDYCKEKYPPHFFDILYKNETLFDMKSKDCIIEFLPHIPFNEIWKCEQTSMTNREVIWKYLQLILFSVIGNTEDKNIFGDSSKLFEAIDEDEFRKKLEETIGQMQDMFDVSNNTFTEEESSNIPNLNSLNAEDLHAHINELLGGKLGQLAKELAEEAAQDLDIDLESTTNIKDLFSKLMKNPGKLMGIVKKAEHKFREKVRSGEISETEMKEEMKDMMDKMKNMPGMENMESMMRNMMGSGMPKGAKMNMNAMNQFMKKEDTKQKMRDRLAAKKAKTEATTSSIPTNVTKQNSLTDEELIRLYQTPDKNLNALPPSKKNKKSTKK